MASKVSVIIATHNHAHFLPECLVSVKAQTYKDYEVIVVDNGSTDNTKEIIKKHTWDKLRYHYQANTGSVAGPRNTGISLSRGKYIAFLDSDDIWYKHKLEKIMYILESNPEIDIISHDLVLRNHDKNTSILKVGPKSENMFKKLLFGNCLLGSATTVKKQVLNEMGGFDENRDFMHAEDYETWLRIAFKNKHFHFLNECLGEYRIHDTNLSHDYETAFNNEIKVINKHIRNYNAENSINKYLILHKSLGKIYLRLAFRCFINRDYIKGVKCILGSFINSPFYFLKFVLGGLKRKVIDRYDKNKFKELGGEYVKEWEK